MIGLFAETGPYQIQPVGTNDATFIQNPNSWTNFANVLYIDNPAG